MPSLQNPMCAVHSGQGTPQRALTARPGLGSCMWLSAETAQASGMAMGMGMGMTRRGVEWNEMSEALALGKRKN